MAGAYLVRGRGWNCNDRDLGISYSFARVVVVSGEATEKNFEQEIELIYQLELQRLNAKREKALQAARQIIES